MTDEDIHKRFDRLETIVEQQQETIDQQQDTIEQQREQLKRLSASSIAAGNRHLVADGGDVKVVGSIDATDGTGVRGHATASGETTGVKGIADADADNTSSPEVIPAGVHGKTTGSNVTHAVRGDTTSTTGRGVAGFATSGSYEHESLPTSAVGTMGVTDRSDDNADLTDSAGVFGLSKAVSGASFGVVGRSNSPDGAAVSGIDVDGGGYGIYSSGDAYTNGNHEITGNLSFPDDTPQRTAGPIAKGYINDDASVTRAVNVDSVTWDSNNSWYQITLNGIEYYYKGFVTTITATTDPVAAETGSVSDDLLVSFEDDAQHDFQFVTYDLPAGTETTSEVETAETDQSTGGAGFGGQ